MPTIRQSRQVNTRNYRPVDPPQAQAPVKDTPIPDEDRQQMSPTMLAAMPAYVTGGDGLQRQFYGNGILPQHRILPIVTRTPR